MVQIVSYTQLGRAIKYPFMYGTSDFGARMRIIFEEPERRTYVRAAYSKPIDIHKWAQCLYKVADEYHRDRASM